MVSKGCRTSQRFHPQMVHLNANSPAYAAKQSNPESESPAPLARFEKDKNPAVNVTCHFVPVPCAKVCLKKQGIPCPASILPPGHLYVRHLEKWQLSSRGEVPRHGKVVGHGIVDPLQVVLTTKKDVWNWNQNWLVNGIHQPCKGKKTHYPRGRGTNG